jgi:hypothetical protein
MQEGFVPGMTLCLQKKMHPASRNWTAVDRDDIDTGSTEGFKGGSQGSRMIGEIDKQGSLVVARARVQGFPKHKVAGTTRSLFPA